jgi:DNA-binding CsgD family transcriptional regulator
MNLVCSSSNRPPIRIGEVTTSARARALQRIGDVSRAGLDLVPMWQEAGDIVARAVPQYMGPCWFTLDPASLLMTSHFNPHMPHLPHEVFEAEYEAEDVHSLADVARSRRGVSTLHEAAGGDPTGSRRWQVNMTIGGDQELIAAARTRQGVWGALSVFRERGAPRFREDEIEFLRSVAEMLGEGIRRALLLGEAQDPEGPDAPGLVVLTEAREVASATPGAGRWISDLPGGDWDRGRLPPSVLAIAGRASASVQNGGVRGEVALARVLSSSGRWVVLHGAALVGDGERRVAVIVEPAHPARIAPLLMAAYGLSEREREITRLVLQGESTAGIADRLVVSPHTVQHHLKSVFEKTGVRSRRDLVGKVFFAFYEPRVRDNETRALSGRPLRGGPVAPDPARPRPSARA